MVKSMTLVAATKRELAQIRKLDEELAAGALAATLLKLAERIDDDNNSLTSVASAAGEYRDVFSMLRSLVPKQVGKDSVDELTKRREQRIARGSRA